jgi:hypothetical protein
MIKTAAGYPLPEHMRAWVLGDPGQLSLVDKPIPMPGRAEVLVRVDAVGICATDLEIIRRGAPAMIRGGAPFNKMFTPGHEYMGTWRRSDRASTNTASDSGSPWKSMPAAGSASAAATACTPPASTTA